jgi:hypothetical protein
MSNGFVKSGLKIWNIKKYAIKRIKSLFDDLWQGKSFGDLTFSFTVLASGFEFKVSE